MSDLRIPSLLALAFALSASLPAQHLELQVTADTYVDQDSPNRNNGSWPIVQFSGQLAGVRLSGTARPLLKFDTTGLAGASVQSAILRLWFNYAKATDLDLHVVQSPWQEGTVTWSTQPQFETAVAASTSYPGGGGARPWDWDITPIVQDWAAGTKANEGLVIRVQDESNSSRLASFLSKEGGFPATLIVDAVASYGQGCGFPMAFGGSSALGASYTLQADTRGTFFVPGFGFVLLGDAPSSLGLAPFGLPGCSLLAQPDAIVPMAWRTAGFQGWFELAVQVPVEAALAGATIYHQGVHYDLLTQTFGTSQGVAVALYQPPS